MNRNDDKIIIDISLWNELISIIRLRMSTFSILLEKIYVMVMFVKGYIRDRNWFTLVYCNVWIMLRRVLGIVIVTTRITAFITAMQSIPKADMSSGNDTLRLWISNDLITYVNGMSVKALLIRQCCFVDFVSFVYSLYSIEYLRIKNLCPTFCNHD